MSVNSRTSHKIYQIYYDSSTQESIDPGFIPLDNLSNERPDWSEYWPIRNFLLNNQLEENTYYGFLSPKFNIKTGLTAVDVNAFLDDTDVDVVSFSPFFDEMAFPFNPYEQATFCHTDSYPIILNAFGFLEPNFSIDQQVMSTENTIYCNYFAAKKSFWMCWLSYCERLFNISEDNSTELAKQINSFTDHYHTHYPAKVFIMERVASFILLLKKEFKVKLLNPINRPFGQHLLQQFKTDLIQMDALKRAYTKTGFIEYLQCYCVLRNEIARKTSTPSE